MRRINKKSKRISKRISDSKANYIIARRRYIDARRRYIDDEIAPQASKLSRMCDKVAAKLKQFATEHPAIAKVIRVILKIRVILGSIVMGSYAVGMAGEIVSLCVAGKEGIGLFKRETGVHPALAIALQSAVLLLGTIEIFAQRKLAKALTPEA